MAVANAYGKVATSGSVFMYDTGDTVNSYIGEPTTNIFNRYGTTGAGAAADNNVNFDVNGNGIFVRLGYGQTFGGYTIQPNDVVYKYDLGAYGCHYHGNDVSIPSGKYVTFTFDYYISPGAGGYPETNYLANMETGTGASVAIASPNSLTGVWQTLSVTAGPTTSAGNLRPLLYPGACGGRLASSGYILFKNPQVELLPHKTPFTQTSRSVTQGLLPIVDNSIIDLSTVSFDSNAQMVFDGTDDRILLSNFTNKPLTAITCETIIKPTRPSVGTGTIRGGAISSTNSMYLGIIDSTDGGITFSMHWANQTVSSRVANVNGQIPNNAYSYLVGTYDGTTARAYLNGVEIWSASQTGNIPDASYYIGTYGGAPVDGVHNFNGYIPIAKMYNRALSASEIKQNYNKYKIRFNLP